MKKLFIVLLAMFLLTGCTVVRIDTQNIENTINVILSKDNQLYNQVGKGYKYYVPRGVTYIDTNELNEKLYSDGTYYYLYIDAISYYHKTKNKYKVDKNAYYSKKLDFGKKTGYIEIHKQGDKYFVEFMYNYAKIEALVGKSELNQTILNASYILSTVKFNNKVIKLMLNENYFTQKEEKYDIFSSKKKTENSDNFLQYNDDVESIEDMNQEGKNEVN